MPCTVQLIATKQLIVCSKPTTVKPSSYKNINWDKVQSTVKVIYLSTYLYCKTNFIGEPEKHIEGSQSENEGSTEL